MSTATYWPPEGQPDFVSHDDEVTWTPLCGCGREMYYRFTPMGSWHCDNFGYHGTSILACIWAEDWPDYEEECERCGVTLSCYEVEDGTGLCEGCGDEAPCGAFVDGHLTCNLTKRHSGLHMYIGLGDVEDEED